MAEQTLYDRLMPTLGGPIQSARAARSPQTGIRARLEQLTHEVFITVAGRIDQVHVCSPVGNARWRGSLRSCFAAAAVHSCPA
jgi:hypothetical protein